MARTELVVPLDFATRGDARRCVDSLKGLDVVLKVGLELYVAEGPSFVRELKKEGWRIMLDLKLHDIPNTVAKATASAAALGVDWLTVHAAGGRKMFANLPSPRPVILGVTVLTSFDEAGWSEVAHAASGSKGDGVAPSVARWVDRAVEWGADGVVCSAHELGALRAKHPKLRTVVPGIRPAGTAVGDQARVMTPAEAAKLGASAIVVGRPITESKDPRAMAQQIIEELSSC